MIDRPQSGLEGRAFAVGFAVEESGDQIAYLPGECIDFRMVVSPFRQADRRLPQLFVFPPVIPQRLCKLRKRTAFLLVNQHFYRVKSVGDAADSGAHHARGVVTRSGAGDVAAGSDAVPHGSGEQRRRIHLRPHRRAEPGDMRRLFRFGKERRPVFGKKFFKTSGRRPLHQGFERFCQIEDDRH
ncbi:hypothetical protein SDC9_171704 [bioreactor metagenome]|uniref:Uncharacterized protein n=1 Tax=bioreactor metagenome TaxID=1076179 RepID=A0A645GBL1_9ZZZZ